MKPDLDPKVAIATGYSEYQYHTHRAWGQGSWTNQISFITTYWFGALHLYPLGCLTAFSEDVSPQPGKLSATEGVISGPSQIIILSLNLNLDYYLVFSLALKFLLRKMSSLLKICKNSAMNIPVSFA